MKIFILTLLCVAIVASADESSSPKVGLKYLPLLYRDWVSNNKALGDLHNEIHANGEVPFSNGQNQFPDMVTSICSFITSTY